MPEVSAIVLCVDYQQVMAYTLAKIYCQKVPASASLYPYLCLNADYTLHAADISVQNS